MAALQQEPTGTYHIAFRFQGRRFKRSLFTKSLEAALQRQAEIEETLRLLQQKRITLPVGIASDDFIMTGGRVDRILPPKDSSSNISALPAITLKNLFAKFFESIPDGNLEFNTQSTMRLHERHFLRLMKPSFPVQLLTGKDLQDYINARAKETTQYFAEANSNTNKQPNRRRVAACTIKKEIATFGTVWRWAETVPILNGKYPNRGLRFPKGDEKPPFQTVAEIRNQISDLVLVGPAADELWECAYLSRAEIEQWLETVKNNNNLPAYLYPMIVTAAYTGARRSELLRAIKTDVEFTQGVITLREKKRVRGKRSTRRVPMSTFLREVLQDWLKHHPGGPSLFCQVDLRCQEFKPITRDQAHNAFRYATKRTEWANLKGWHTLRHSFISNLACEGVDQRLIDEFVGHTTEEMRRRYRHLFPDVKSAAIASVFG